MSVTVNPQNNDNIVINNPTSNKVVVNQQSVDKVVVTKTAQEVLRVSTGIKGDTGPQGPVGPIGPTGEPGVYVGSTAPADTSLLWVDTSSSVSAGSSQQIFGLADPQDYPDLPTLLVERTNTTTGWTSINSAAAISVDSSFGVGKEAIKAHLQAGTGNSSLTSRFYKNFTTPVDMGLRGAISFELRKDWAWHTDSNPPPYEVVAATGPNLTGTLYTTLVNQAPDYVWGKAYVSVPSGTQISSIGIRSIIRTGPYLTDTYIFWVRDICLEAASNVQVAQFGNKTPIVTESVTEGTSGYVNPITNSPKLDLRRDTAVVPGLGGWWDVREWGVPEDGVTDIAPIFNQILNDLPDGASLRFPANGAFLVKSQITVIKPVTIDFNNSVLYDNERRTLPGVLSSADFILVTGGVTDVTLSNGRIYATWFDTYTTGGWLTTVAGTVSTSGTSSVLASVGDSGEFQPRDLSGNQYVRWLAQHYEPTYGVINRFDISLSGDGVSTAIIEIVTDAGVSLSSATVTPPSTATTYTLRCNPPDLNDRLFIRVTKASGSAAIVIPSVTPWGMTTYDGDYEFSNGIVVANASRVLVDNWRIENTGGEGIVYRCFDYNLGDIVFRDVVCRGNHTQNYAPTAGRNVRFERCASEASGRTGFDIEPYGTGWSVDNIVLSDCRSTNDRNFSISCNNWFYISNLVIENFVARDWGMGAFIGGSIGGRINNFTSVSKYTTGSDMQISGQQLVVSNLSLAGSVQLKGSSYTVDGNVVTSYGNRVTDFTINSMSDRDTHWPNGQVVCTDLNAVISGGSYDTFSPSITGTLTYSNAAYISGRPTLLGLELGKWRSAFPKLYKGVAVDGLWWPYGITADEGLVKTEGISATATKSQNLRGISVSVGAGATSTTVTFPGDQSGSDFEPVSSWTVLPNAYTGTGTPTLTVGSSYYYAICARVEYDDNGHKPAYGTLSGTALSASAPAYYLYMNGVFNISNGNVIAGLDIYRGSTGTAASGPWDTRYTVSPTSPWFSTGNSFQLYDLGTELRANMALAWRIYGYPNIESSYGVIATAQAGSWDLTTGPFTDTSGYEADANYSITITPSWITTIAVTAKRQSGFDVSFGTPAPAGATFDWVLIR